MEKLESVPKPERIRLDLWEEVVGEFIEVIEEEDRMLIRLSIDEKPIEIECLQFEGNYYMILEILQEMEEGRPISILRTDIPEMELCIDIDVILREREYTTEDSSESTTE